MKPYEIIAGPVDVWLAPKGEPWPEVSSTPAGNWVKLGTSGSKNYSEEGVSVEHPQTQEDVRVLGSTGPVKSYRTEEGLFIGLTLLDLSLDHYRYALNSGTVSNTAAGSGTAGISSLPIRRGSDITEYALVLKGGMSPEGDDWSMQYQVPRVVEAGEPEGVFTKGEPAGLAIRFKALEDDTQSAGNEFGSIVVQTADPS